MKISLALLALVAATDSGYDAVQEPVTQEPVTQEPVTQEGQEYSQYTASGVQEAALVCLGNCPTSAQCQNKLTGECFAPVGYHDEETKYYEEKEIEAVCPDDSFDTAHVRLTNHTALWVGFGLLFAPALYVWWLIFYDSAYAAMEKEFKTKHNFASPFAVIEAKFDHFFEFLRPVKFGRMISFTILFIASLAYLTMALGYGFTLKCDGREFYFARYIDWFLTTPLILHEIMARSNADTHERYFVIFMDIIMIVAGLIASLVSGNNKWVFFAFSCLAFLPILYFLVGLRHRLLSNHPFFHARFTQIVTVTIITWIQYPIVWILTHGTNTISASGETIWYTVLDVIAKSFLAYLLVTRNFIQKAIHTAVTASSLL